MEEKKVTLTTTKPIIIDYLAKDVDQKTTVDELGNVFYHRTPKKFSAKEFAERWRENFHYDLESKPMTPDQYHKELRKKFLDTQAHTIQLKVESLDRVLIGQDEMIGGGLLSDKHHPQTREVLQILRNDLQRVLESFNRYRHVSENA